jgi:hypothetical protein
VLDAGVTGVGDALDALRYDELLVAVFLFWFSGGRALEEEVREERKRERERAERERKKKRRRRSFDVTSLCSLLSLFLPKAPRIHSTYRSGALAIVLKRRNYRLFWRKERAG